MFIQGLALLHSMRESDRGGRTLLPQVWGSRRTGGFSWWRHSKPTQGADQRPDSRHSRGGSRYCCVDRRCRGCNSALQDANRFGPPCHQPGGLHRVHLCSGSERFQVHDYSIKFLQRPSDDRRQPCQLSADFRIREYSDDRPCPRLPLSVCVAEGPNHNARHYSARPLGRKLRYGSRVQFVS